MISTMLRFTVSKSRSVSEYFVNLIKSRTDDERVTRFADYFVDVIISEKTQYSPEV
jgi:hypothetical protein